MRFRCIFRFLLGDKIREMRSERKKSSKEPTKMYWRRKMKCKKVEEQEVTKSFNKNCHRNKFPPFWHLEPYSNLRLRLSSQYLIPFCLKSLYRDSVTRFWTHFLFGQKFGLGPIRPYEQAKTIKRYFSILPIDSCRIHVSANAKYFKF